MKISIITLHCPANCGSVLQGYALCKFLRDRYGSGVSLIDYVPSYMETEGRGLRTLLRKTLFFRAYRKRTKNFARFIQKNCVLSEKKYTDYRMLEMDPPVSDLYITGSDQLWNPCFECGRDPAYYLKFVSDVPKLAYATSMGTDRYTKEQLEEIAEKIRDYSAVSLREKCSCEQLASVGVEKVEWVCDPTFLLSSDVYDSIATDYKHLGKYVAVYLVEKSDLLDRTLDRFRAMGYKIVGVGGYLKKYKCDVHFKDAGPAEFLGLIRDASFVVATSFHASVFSQIFHKEFAIIPPKMNPARIEQLLGYTGLQSRIITDPDQLGNLDTPIDYAIVQSRLDALIEHSKKWLIEAVEKERS
ncbi:MAG: polysaccharide pyruvyl transferase family protein [Ruminococcaceae bacterium]|nr:polysaccharide pyruvyl transferase family protein [Oscillospiraceae bacterium]